MGLPPSGMRAQFAHGFLGGESLQLFRFLLSTAPVRGGITMSSLLALSVSIGGLGAVATWLALGPLSGIMLIWAAFIGWGCYFAAGGNADALKATITCGVFGAICAWVAALLILNVDIGALTAPIWVGVTVLILVYASQVEALATIPASVYGYASSFAYMLHANALNEMSVMAASFDNPLVIISVSIAIGAVFGALSSRLAGMLGSD